MEPQAVSVSVEDRIAVITLNNPPVNALSGKVLRGLSSTLDRLEGDPAVKVVIITGTGMFFVAGADIKEMAGAAPSGLEKKAASAALEPGSSPGAAGGVSGGGHSGANLSLKKTFVSGLLKIKPVQRFLYNLYGKKAAALGQRTFDRIESMSKPVIAAINGVCLGGGMELAMACHLRIASDRAQMGQPEIKLGIIPGFGGTQRLPRYLGRAKALQFLLTGENISVQEAKAAGLLNDVVPDGEVLRHSKGLARRIASMGGVAIASILRAVREGSQLPLGEGLWLEASLFGHICTTEDMKEGLKAFIEKRQPKFQDR